jgi:hypothetical protein
MRIRFPAGVWRFPVLLFPTVLFFLMLFVLPVKAQEGHIPPGLGGTFIGPWTVGLQARYTAPYQSFTRASDAFPYRRSDMLCLGEFWAADLLVHLERDWFRHYFMSTYALPTALRSPVAPAANAPGVSQADHPPGGSAANGSPGGSAAGLATGGPAAGFDPPWPDILREPASSYQRLHFQYYFNLPMYRQGRLRSWYGLSSSVLYEKRKISFLSGMSEDKWDVNIGLGPTLAGEVALSRRLAFRTEGHVLFYTPYTSFGKTRSLVIGPGDEPEARDGDYQNFFVASLLDARFRYHFSREVHLNLGYRFISQNGHAVLTAGSAERLAYKLDRLHEFYIGLHLNIPSTWRKRKTNPPCPLSG